MTLREIDRIRSALRMSEANTVDFYSAVEEAEKFHHKVSELQEMLLLIRRKCQMELRALDRGEVPSPAHLGFVLEFILGVVEDSRHVKAA